MQTDLGEWCSLISDWSFNELDGSVVKYMEIKEKTIIKDQESRELLLERDAVYDQSQ